MDQMLELIPTILEILVSFIKTIYRMAGNVKANKDRCQKLTKRVRSIEELVLKIQEKGWGQISPSLEDTLRDLCYTLQSTEEWMRKYTQTKDWKRFFKGGSHEEKFRELNEDLSEKFQLLSLALQVEHGEKIDIIYDTLTQRGSAAIRQRAPIPSFSPPQPSPAAQALVPSMPQTSSFSPGVNYAPFSQTFYPVIPQTVPLSNIGFSNTICSPSWVSQYLNFSNMTPMNGAPQYSSVAFSNNGTVTYVTKSSFYVYQ